jgi:hypothetical protein
MRYGEQKVGRPKRAARVVAKVVAAVKVAAIEQQAAL